MEFWGVEIKGGEPLKVKPDDGKIVHLSQASLGEVKKSKGNDSVPLFLKFNDQKLVIGTLSSDTCTQLCYDLVFEKEFELSHNWKNGSIYFCGYQAGVKSLSIDDSTDSDSGEELPVNAKENGQPQLKKETSSLPTGKSDATKSEISVAKPKVETVEPKKDEKSKEDEDSESDDDDDDDSEDGSFDQIMSESEDDSSDNDDESSDEEDEPTPVKAEPSKKRPAVASPSKSGKKAKLVTPEKTGGDSKKGNVHVATPYPKQANKAAANSDTSKQQTPKTAVQVSCKTCSKTFGSEAGLQSHTKAKHSGAK